MYDLDSMLLSEPTSHKSKHYHTGSGDEQYNNTLERYFYYFMSLQDNWCICE